MKALLSYALVGGFIVVLGGWLAARMVGEGASTAVWVGAGLAYGVQLIAFAFLLLVRRREDVTIWIAFGAGMLLRLGVVLAAALWLVGYAALDPAPLLLSLVGFLFVLLILESALFRVGMRSR